MKKLLILLLVNLLYLPISNAFPENVQLGYSGCQSCHVNPTGGGLLSTYGRRLTEERLSTWSSEKSGDVSWGAWEQPKWLKLGGNLRYLNIDIDNDLFKYNRSFLMQAEVEAAATFLDGSMTAVASFGRYDGTSESQQHYLMYQVNDNLILRGGKFMPAFGINAVEHHISTRKALFLNQGQETYNLELGYVDSWGEVFVDGIVGGSAGETGEKETGGTLKFAFYIFDSSQVGASYMHLSGPGYDRDAYGPQIIVGLYDGVYLTSDYILQKRTLEAGGDIPEKTEEGYFSFSKLGYEPFKGFHLLAQLDQRQSDKNNELTFYQAFGPGIQWLPYPHFELSTSYYSTRQKFFGTEIKGSSFMFMGHFYL